MARLRREPQPPTPRPRPKSKPLAPLHQRILGKHQTEFDTVEDLRYKLELAYDSDEIEFDMYSQCHDALDVREEKAREGLLKASGRWVKPDKHTFINARKVSEKKPLTGWRLKLLWVFLFLVFWKFLSLKP